LNNEIETSESKWWIELNLPKLIAGPAGQALSRLIGGATDIPAAWLEEIAQGIRDRKDARTAVSKALAGAAAELARNDDAIVQRATNAFLAKAIRAQENKEAVARKAVESLQESPNKSEDSEGPAAPDDDWFNVFEQYAEQASSEKLQDLWGRILAGEIRKPKSFSLRTLRFIAELDQETASLFEKYADAVVANNFIPKPQSLKSPVLTELLQLQDCGLVAEVLGTVVKPLPIKGPFGVLLPIADMWVQVTGKEDQHLNVPSILLTKVGREIVQILKKPFSLARAEEFAKIIPKGGVEQIRLVRIVPADRGRLSLEVVDTLWKKEQKPATD
jgi:hypothetical protein